MRAGAFPRETASRAVAKLIADGKVGKVDMRSAETGEWETLYYSVRGPPYMDTSRTNVLCNACGRMAAEADRDGTCRGCGA